MDFVATRKSALELLEQPASEHGFELVDIALSGARSLPTLTVFLDDGKGNSLDDLAKANAWIEELIEEANLFEGSYVLEVSSPGINRPLRKLSDFERFAGQKVEIKVEAAKGERSVFKGVLAGVKDDKVLVETDAGTCEIESGHIQKAHLIVPIDFKSLKGTSKND